MYNKTKFLCVGNDGGSPSFGGYIYCVDGGSSDSDGASACECSAEATADGGLPRDDAGLIRVCDDASTSSPCAKDDSECPDANGNKQICMKQEGPSRCVEGCRRDDQCRGGFACENGHCVAPSATVRDDSEILDSSTTCATNPRAECDTAIASSPALQLQLQ